MFVEGKKWGCVREFRSLSSGTKARGQIEGGRASNSSGMRRELSKGLGNNARSGDTDFTSDMVNGDGKTEEFCSVHFDSERVVKLQAANKVFSPCQVLELDTEVIDDEGKSDAVGDMLEEADCASLMVAVRSKALDEDILCDLAGVR
jgi:hypothetical protein